jgi:hypothetical protein
MIWKLAESHKIAPNFSFLTHITQFKYQKIQIEVPYNSSKWDLF